MTANQFHLILFFLCFSITASATDFYVSPSGNDLANGLYPSPHPNIANGPFKTLARAQSAIRNLKTAGNFNQPITVHVAPGTYPLSSPLQFDSRDAGTPGQQITWQGKANATTVVSGGITLLNCTSANGLWRCPATGLGLDSIKYSTNSGRLQGNLPGFNLFINQQRLTLARWPNSDPNLDKSWAHIKLVIDETPTFSSFEQLPALTPSELKNAVVHIFPSSDWFDQYLPVTSFTPTLNDISLGANVSVASGQRFYLLNLLSQLDAPGEWFYDQPNAQVLFMPPVGVTPQNIAVSALPNLMTLNGLSYVNFQNLSFQDSTDVAISISNSNNLLLNNIEITNVDTTGIQTAACSNITVSNSFIHDTGQGGLIIDGGNRQTLQSSNNLVADNHFANFGMIILTYSPGVSATGVGAQISNNLIEQGAGGGVMVNGNNHIFEKNEVTQVCSQASDCGAYYTGRDWTYRGNVISNNNFHDIAGYGLQSVNVAQNTFTYASPANVPAVYLDDAVSGFNVTGNIFNNAGSKAIQIGGGRDHVIQNNVFNVYNNSFAIYIDDRWPGFDWLSLYNGLMQMIAQNPLWIASYPALAAYPALSYPNISWPENNTIQNNVFIANNNGGGLDNLILPQESTNINNNLYWAASGNVVISYQILDYLPQPLVANYQSWQNWMQLGIEKNSINANPCATFNGDRVRFCAKSPVGKIGFLALPTDIGLSK
jgi:hypothetical protein